jgi:hypothetical protein
MPVCFPTRRHTAGDMKVKRVRVRAGLTIKMVLNHKIHGAVVVEIKVVVTVRLDDMMSGRIDDFPLGRLCQREQAYPRRTRSKSVSVEPFMQRLRKLRACSGGPLHGFPPFDTADAP